MSKLLEFLFISNLKGVGKKTIHKKYIDAIWRCDDLSDLIETYLPMIKSFSNAEIDQAKDSAQKQMEELQRTPEVSAITFFDDLYPASVKALGESAPLILYVKGDRNSLVGKNIAVVGTRKPSDHTTAVERNLVGKIIDLSGSTIVSGLALGCDRIAHETTVNKKGRTIAVLPSGVENVVPSQHKELAEQIVAGGGCLVSEYRIHAPATKGTFIERDSLIAALSEVTVVAECSVKSGTMHTVDAAVKLKRKIACYMPSDLTKGSYEGNLHMVQNMDAIPLKDTEDLKRIYEIEVPIIRKKLNDAEACYMGYNNNHAGMHMIWFRPRFDDYAYDRTIEEQWRIKLKKEKLASQKAEMKTEAPVVIEEEPVSNKNQNNTSMKQNNKTKKNHLMQSNDNEYGTEFIANGAFFADADLVTQNIVFMALKNKKDLYRIFKEADEIMKKDARMNPSPDSRWYGYPLLNRAMIYMRIIADKLDCNYQEFFLDNSQLIKKHIYKLLDEISIESWEGEFDEESGEADIRIESFDDKLLGRDITKQTLEARWEFKTMDLCLYKEYDEGKPFYSVSYGSINVDTRNGNNNSVWGAYLLLEEEGKVKDLVEKLIEMHPEWGY